ncbi:MAG: hypothetical protein IBJ00_00720 [Alphaproteobacteria bacterium]|nr:hypothetical protein [Alphaproteobacteria bacterium]
MLNATESSNVKLVEIDKAEVWLGALLLGKHANILSYQKFGGLESELMHLWHLHWRETRYLETSPELLTIQKQHEKGDYVHNCGWSRKSFASIMSFLKSDEQTLRAINAKKWEERLKVYSWEVIKHSDINRMPRSAIERNKLWADKLISFINSETNIPPLLIVVGDGHLAGYYQKWSLLSMLKDNLDYSLSRFSSKGEWIEIDEGGEIK